MRVGVADEKVEIDLVGVQQFVNQRQNEQAVGSRTNADPLVGDRGIAGADRIDRDDLGAARLELGQAGLDRIGIMVFRDAEKHEVLRRGPNRVRRIPRNEPPIV